MKKVIGIVIGMMGIALSVFGAIGKQNEGFSVSLVGGVDGPTSVFLAGTVGADYSNIMIIVGIIAIIISGILLKNVFVRHFVNEKKGD